MRRSNLRNAVARVAIAGGLVLGMSQGASASLMTFFGENLTPGGTVSGDPTTANSNFLAALSAGVGTEDFEGFDLDVLAPLSLTFPGSTGSITATLSGGGPAEVRETGGGRFATSGDQYLDTDGGASFTITFSSPIAAFGFYGTDIGDFGGQITLDLMGSGVTEELTVPNSTNAPDGALLFFGFVDTVNTYSSIVFGNTSGSDFFGFDDMTVGDPGQVVNPNPVPVPATLALLGLGLLGLGRKRARS